jgi:hypothetical protein
MSQPAPDKRCPNHQDADIELVVNPSGSHHYGKYVCSECSKFISHARKPTTSHALEKRQQEIYPFIKARVMSDADLKFILSIYNIPHLNLVQERRYNDIYTLYSAT